MVTIHEAGKEITLKINDHKFEVSKTLYIRVASRYIELTDIGIKPAYFHLYESGGDKTKYRKELEDSEDRLFFDIIVYISTCIQDSPEMHLEFLKRFKQVLTQVIQLQQCSGHG